MERLQQMMGMQGQMGGGPTIDDGQTDNSEQVLISSLALLKVMQIGISLPISTLNDASSDAQTW